MSRPPARAALLRALTHAWEALQAAPEDLPAYAPDHSAAVALVALALVVCGAQEDA